MPNYKIADLLENPENTQRLYGYCGKIARINLMKWLLVPALLTKGTSLFI